jgi:excisionase family DNA binding protein
MAMVYDFEAEAKRLIEAIEPQRGATMTVLCALREAFDAGKADTERELVTILEAARRAQVCRRTVYNWLRDDKVEAVRNPGGSVRIYADTLILPLGEFISPQKLNSKKKSFLGFD